MPTHISRINKVRQDFISFFFPPACTGCGKVLHSDNQILCPDCQSRLSYTGYEKWPQNPVMDNLSGRVPLLQAWALLNFKKQGCTRQMLHRLKYDHKPEIGVFLGHCLAEKCLETECLKNVDYAVPVPVHPKKQKKRGYNQALCIIEGLTERIPRIIPLPDLLCKQETQSQTKKNRALRWENVKSAYTLNRYRASLLPAGPIHILLVDDVITTGATIESCCRELLLIPQVKLSVIAAASPM